MKPVRIRRFGTCCRTLVVLLSFAAFLAQADEPALRIAVMSDLQGYDYAEFNGMRNMERMLDVYAPLKPDVVVNNGDIGDNGVDGWKGAQFYFDRCTARLGKLPHVVTIGNHELTGWVPGDWTTADAAARNMKLFNGVFGYDANRLQTRTIKGYDFIAYSFKTTAGYTDEELVELRAALDRAVARDGTKPIFVVTHYHPHGTVPGSEGASLKPLRAVLNDYPQVVNLSGHTHRPLRDPRSIWQGEFTVIETSTLSYGCVVEKPQPLNQVSELMPYEHESVGGLFLEVYADRLVARRYSARDRREIEPGNPWTFALPYNPKAPKYDYASRAAAEIAPEFPAEVEPTVWWDCGFFYFMWNPVTDPAKVLKYRVEATTQDGKVRTWYFLADFYRTPSHRAERVVCKLPPDPFKLGDRVSVTITPIGFFGKEGRPCVWSFTSKFRYKNRTQPFETCQQ